MNLSQRLSYNPGLASVRTALTTSPYALLLSLTAVMALIVIALAIPRHASGQGTSNLVVTVSAASYDPNGILAPDSIAAAFGTKLATQFAAAASLPLPTSLAGTPVKVKDRAGVERLALLLFVSPGQINYVIPSGTAVGAATVTVQSGDGAISSGTVEVRQVAPGIFTANGGGTGPLAGYLLRVKADG